MKILLPLFSASSSSSLLLLLRAQPSLGRVRRIGHRSHTRVSVDSCRHGCVDQNDESEQQREIVLIELRHLWYLLLFILKHEKVHY